MEFTKTEMGLYAAEIGGRQYEFSKWGAGEAMDTLLDLASIVGKPLGAMAQGMDPAAAAEKRVEVTIDAIGTIVEQLASQVGANKKTCLALIRKLATQGVLCEGKPVTSFDLHYKDQLAHLFDVLGANLEVQYGNFFGGLAGAFRIVGGRPAPSSPGSPSQPSTSSSGGR